MPCIFRLDTIDGLGRRWCRCARLETHPAHAPLPPSPAGLAELEARRLGEHNDEEPSEE